MQRYCAMLSFGGDSGGDRTAQAWFCTPKLHNAPHTSNRKDEHPNVLQTVMVILERHSLLCSHAAPLLSNTLCVCVCATSYAMDCCLSYTAAPVCPTQ